MSIHHKLKKRIMLRATAALMIALLSFPCAIAEESAGEAPAYLDDQSDSVRQAQRRLIDLGLLNGSADGVYGRKTEAALREYQRQNGLEETGHLDAATLDALTYVSPESATAQDVQQRLIDLGYLTGKADGIIGPRSVDALKMFQRINEIAVTGKIDADVLVLLFSGEAQALPAALSSGDKGEAVERLQKKLIQFGFMEGEPDASYGQSTRNAVRDFQKHLIEQGYSEGIEANGVATALTQYCLFNARYSPYLRDVQPGVSDSEARRVERRLTALGYMDLPADDVLDDYAIAALKLFQEQMIMQPDGLADRETLEALFGAEAPPARYCAPHDVAFGDRCEAIRNAWQALARGGMTTAMPGDKFDKSMQAALEKLYDFLTLRSDPKAELFSDPKALSAEAQTALQGNLLGYRAFDPTDEATVARAQRRLYGLLFLPKSEIDGKQGPNTASALKAFQETNHLAATGELDPDTQAALFSADALPKLYPYRVEVSIDRQKVDVYALTIVNTYELAQSFTCSTGTHDSTPRGIFLNGFPVNRWHHFEKFNCWAQYSFEITGDIMFHSVIYSSDNENSLRHGSVSALGSPASHGCIRLSVADAKWLFEHCKKGTLAIIIY